MEWPLILALVHRPAGSVYMSWIDVYLLLNRERSALADIDLVNLLKLGENISRQLSRQIFFLIFGTFFIFFFCVLKVVHIFSPLHRQRK